MIERPILFSAPMVRAILEGRKTQTRRVGKIQSDDYVELGAESIGHATKGYVIQATYAAFPGKGTARWAICECPYGKPGDRLWVKETFQPVQLASEVTQWRYAATDKKGLANWRPSIFMPRWASRITLEITGVRVERLQEISEEDAINEGVERLSHGFKDYTCKLDAQLGDAKMSYFTLWESINGKGSWDANPWVWVVAFKQVFND